MHSLGGRQGGLGAHGGHGGQGGDQVRGVHSLPASFTKRNSWNKAVSEAEKLVPAQNHLKDIPITARTPQAADFSNRFISLPPQVGYPTSLLSVRALLDNDFANIAVSPKNNEDDHSFKIQIKHKSSKSISKLSQCVSGAPEEVDRLRPPGVAHCQEVDLPWQEQDAGRTSPC